MKFENKKRVHEFRMRYGTDYSGQERTRAYKKLAIKFMKFHERFIRREMERY